MLRYAILILNITELRLLSKELCIVFELLRSILSYKSGVQGVLDARV